MESVGEKKNIVVIGGGPAGIEAAKALSAAGYTAFLIEKESYLGGHLAKWDRLFPHGVSAEEVLNNMTSSMGCVKWFVSTEVRQINKLDKRYNVILDNGLTVIADAILFTTGFSLFQAQRKEEYGYGIYDSVITNADLEEYFKRGKSLTVKNPEKIGFVHCVGSRDEKVGNRYCSKVCCATAVKQAIEIKAKFPDATVYCFYMDLRMFGRGYEDLYLEAQKDSGVIFVRGRISEVAENKDGSLLVKAEDTLAGKPLRVNLDLLVLMAGMVHNPANEPLSKMLSLASEHDGFFRTADSILEDRSSSKKGIFYAGTCTGPKTLPETIADARATVCEIDKYFREERQ